ncbi:sodium:proton antiporter [Pedobacter sp. SYSU D00535]|uniref:cation:proton antiporter n=1 Tax=Pedobacter sp. SYSU D00535 TaxID=2810308 RepID=UPI001A964F86|nr:sodium:proton antiporter [Pedobacter sp. SYSU D00535]
MDIYIIGLTVVGIASLAMAWMPAITQKTGISYSIWYVLAGIIIYTFFDFFPTPDPIREEDYAVHLSELVVIISLMGTGLKIDEAFSLKGWAIPFKLVTLTMILSIAGVALLSYYILGFDLPSAILLGAVLAPTDPVLASDVQVGPPLEKQKNNVRFALTAEAGMNDGMAFPFTWLAIALALSGGTTSGVIGDWVMKDIFYRILVGVALGYFIGRLIAWLIFYLPRKNSAVEMRDGFVAVSVTLASYGITELFQGYGFIAVFITAITIRNYELDHQYHTKMHSFTDQIERIALAIVLILFGGSLATGILGDLSWYTVAFALGFIFILRPFTAYISLIGSGFSAKEKSAISFFGIRGMGSFFYLAFALKKANFQYADELWAAVSFVVLISIIIHGCTAALGMRLVEEETELENEKKDIEVS